MKVREVVLLGTLLSCAQAWVPTRHGRCYHLSVEKVARTPMPPLRVRVLELDEDDKVRARGGDMDFFGTDGEVNLADYCGEAGIQHPAEIVGKAQLEEKEDSSTTISALTFLADGTVQFGETDGPKPDDVQGAWSADDTSIVITLKRTFETRQGGSYSVTRVMRGDFETNGAPKTAMGEVLIDEYAVGYFSLVFVPNDADSVDHLEPVVVGKD